MQVQGKFLRREREEWSLFLALFLSPALPSSDANPQFAIIRLNEPTRGLVNTVSCGSRKHKEE